MTFNKKSPDVVNLYFRRGGLGMGEPEGQGVQQPPPPQQQQQQEEETKRRSYRITRKEDFIACLQERLRRFK
jgi:hypothetical protein